MIANHEQQQDVAAVCVICGYPRRLGLPPETVVHSSRGGVGLAHPECVAEWHARQRRYREAAEVSARVPLAGLPVTPWSSMDDPGYQARVHPTLASWARQWHRQSDGSALLIGPSGAGKTTAAQMLVRRLVEDEIADLPRALPHDWESWSRHTQWHTACDLVRARREHPLGREADAKAIRQAKQATLLIIDELGSEPRSDVLFEIVDARYVTQLPTIATSGLTAREFAGRYGTGMMRRLIDEDIGAALVDCWGDDG